MTRDEAIKELKKELLVCENPCLSYQASKNALKMAIKALEKKPKTDILDKIMAEITTSNRGTCDYYIVDRIEEIINEYKSEDKE